MSVAMRVPWVVAILLLAGSAGQSDRKCKLVLEASTLAVAASDAAIDAAAPASEVPVGKSADAAAIRKSSAEFQRAFEAGDAKAAAACWTTNGEYRGESGEVIRGRANLEKAYEALFRSSPKSQAKIEIQSLHFPTPDLALEEGVFLVKPLGPELPVATRYSAVHVREEGKWKVAQLREWSAAGGDLSELAWLVGNWRAMAGSRQIEWSFAWNPARTFLIQSFQVKEQGQPTSSGTRMIGIDPQSGALISWSFPDSGGHGQARWTREGNHWRIDQRDILPDGLTTTATDILSRVNDNEFSWRAFGRRIGDTNMPDLAPAKFTRVPVSPSPRAN